MKKSQLSDLSQLSAKEFSGEPVADLVEQCDTNEQEEESVEVSDEQLFREYMESGKSDADMEQYEQDTIPTHKKPNGNMADILPPELSQSQEKSSKSTQASQKDAEQAEKEAEAEEDDFEKIMNRTGFHFDEESGTLNF